jgi:Tfp pilus assembly protein PilF
MGLPRENAGPVAASRPKPAELDATLRQALRLHQGGRPSEAEPLYRGILRFLPDHPGVSNYLGIALKDQGKVEEAAAVFRRTVTVAPDHAPAQCNLGNVLFEQGLHAEAEAAYRRALALSPDMPDALKNLGFAIVHGGRFEESIPWFRRHAERVYGRPDIAAPGRAPAPPHQTRHDDEQRDYLKAQGVGADAASTFHLEAGDRLRGPAVKADRSLGEVAARWKSASPQIAVVDDLLTDEALHALQRYCWRSTIWRKPYPNGYLGAMPEHGFACPLLAQIADELRSAYPVLVGEHALLRWWGYKYDSRLDGIQVHADFAAINVNFWITPDEANLDPESGGMVIWDKPAPQDWTFAQYNAPGAGQAIRDWLARAGARPRTVPYRANRAVIFDSDLFHETDRIAFKEGYLNRRINITLLYGRRETAFAPEGDCR